MLFTFKWIDVERFVNRDFFILIRYRELFLYVFGREWAEGFFCRFTMGKLRLGFL